MPDFLPVSLQNKLRHSQPELREQQKIKQTDGAVADSPFSSEICPLACTGLNGVADATFFGGRPPLPLAVPEKICVPLPRLYLIFSTAALSSIRFIRPRREPPTLSSSRRGTPLAAQGSSIVTAKNDPPDHFLNAASSHVFCRGRRPRRPE